MRDEHMASASFKCFILYPSSFIILPKKDSPRTSFDGSGGNAWAFVILLVACYAAQTAQAHRTSLVRGRRSRNAGEKRVVSICFFIMSRIIVRFRYFVK